jgi:hypothetical protein
VAVPAVPRIHVLGSDRPRPPSERTLYVDGSAGSGFRDSVDLELSHWVPTRTPARWAADTSTEICMRFLEDPPPDAAAYDVAINNHVDVDGILSLFTLAHPDVALPHRDVVVGAAEMADLAAGVDRAAFVLAQELTLAMGGFGGAGRDPLDTYEAVFAVALDVLAGSRPETASVTDGWELLETQADLLGSVVAVDVVAPRLVAYRLPEPGDDAERGTMLAVPPFNAVVDGSVWLWPHVRNRDHGQAAHLVSVPLGDGWAHDLWLPGYVWAHTPDRWRPAVLEGTGSSNTWRIRSAALTEAVRGLQGDERGAGTWVLADEVDPFAAVPGRAFPVILSVLDDGSRPVPSAQTPDEVAERLAPAFED